MRRKLWLFFVFIFGTVLATSAPAQAATRFSDVNPAEYGWAEDAISFMVGKGVISGYPDGTFKPGRFVDKAEMTVMIYRLFDRYRPNSSGQGSNDNSYSIKQFADVPSNHWAYKEISSLINISWWNAVQSSPKGYLFYPDAKLNRIGAVNLLPLFMLAEEDLSNEEVYQIVSAMRDVPIVVSSYSDDELFMGHPLQEDGRYDENAGNKTNLLFPLLFAKDGNELHIPDDYSGIVASDLALLQKTGIMTAYNGEFEAQDMLTRAEAVTILHRLYLRLKQTGALAEYSSK
ncbi:MULTISPECIES: S-layer homology domain-containing protein [Brevibacillus]|uniref:S-layer homology domain-containing protein n=1 Tax=Brevibacillus TaxID=55080 RepID=UPI00156B5835|nr:MULTISPECIES: S-layer homology domain-containing protein [Brevibacillus]MED2256479.1 S-layer homology domain-containing protein [Brevibacillus parabrevis]UED70492.1 S-layer homology domain-containing protein [Brevibacillus sp. HD3.3A]